MTAPSVRICQVSKTFETRRGLFTAIEHVSFDVRPGEFVAVVGPSGCGKSTLLSLVAGLEPVSWGQIEVAGQLVSNVRHDVGLLFQKDVLLPWRTVLDNVAMPLIFQGERRSRALERARVWVERVGLGGFADYYPHQLSGGMRKRVSLAALFVYGPEILLMDEPFTALDVQTRKLMEDELLDLWAENRKTVVFITHDLEEAIALSDRVIVMTASPGRVKSDYAVDLARPRHVAQIRFRPAFTQLYEQIWGDLEGEVAIAYQRQTTTTTTAGQT